MSIASSELLFLDDICDQFELRLRDGNEVDLIQRFAEEQACPSGKIQTKLISNLLLIEWDYRLEQSNSPNLESYLDLELLSPQSLKTLFSRWQNSRFGSQIFDSFQLIEQLGEGRFGSVWKAIDQDSGKTVAVKIAHPSLIEDSRQFFRESKAALNLRHPNIANVITSGEWKSRPYIVREYVEGQTLTRELQQNQFTPLDAAGLTLCLAKTLAYSHSVGCVHRDLKPGNIIIRSDGKPILIDFGLAKTVGSSGSGTGSGVVMGTPVYMAPEQASGNSNSADARSDVYSLGVVLFEMLTGRRPFEGSFEATLYQVLRVEPANPRRLNARIPRSLSNICLKCLRKNPKDRYQSSDELADDLQRFLLGESVTASPDGQLKRAWRFSKANPAIAAWAACSFILLLTLAIVSIYSERNMRALWKRETQLRSEAVDAKRISDHNAEQATLESELSQQITLFLNNVFLTADPVSTYIMGAPGLGNPDMTATDILNQAANRIETELKRRPRLQARLMAIIGGVNCNLGRIQPARLLLEKARVLTTKLRTEFPDKDFRRDEAILKLNEGRLYHYVGEYQRASDCFEQTLELHEKMLPIDEGKIAEILLQAGWLYIEYKKPELASQCFDQVLKRNAPQLHKDTNLKWAVRLAQAHCDNQKLRFAWLACQAFFSIKDRNLAGLVAKVVATQLAKEFEWYDVALILHREIVREMESRFSSTSRWAILANGDYASTLFDAGFYADALTTIEPLMELGKKIAPKHPHIQNFYSTIGFQKLLSEQFDEAVFYFSAAQNNPIKSEHYNFDIKLWLVEALVQKGDFKEAKNLLPPYEKFPHHHDRGARIQNQIWFHLLNAKICRGFNDEKSTQKHLLKAKEIAGPNNKRYLPSSIIFRHVWLYQQLGDKIRVEQLLRLALEKDLQRFPIHHPRIADSHFRMGEFLLGENQVAKAKSHLETALKIRESRLPSNDPRIEKTRKLLRNPKFNFGE